MRRKHKHGFRSKGAQSYTALEQAGGLACAVSIMDLGWLLLGVVYGEIILLFGQQAASCLATPWLLPGAESSSGPRKEWHSRLIYT